MTTETKLAILKINEAHEVVSNCLGEKIDALNGIAEVSPLTNVQTGLCEIHQKIHDMFCELEARIKRMDKT